MKCQLWNNDNQNMREELKLTKYLNYYIKRESQNGQNVNYEMSKLMEVKIWEKSIEIDKMS